jgi:methylmalonyl-CoA mutase cobalamin-binding subunit
LPSAKRSSTSSRPRILATGAAAAAILAGEVPIQAMELGAPPVSASAPTEDPARAILRAEAASITARFVDAASRLDPGAVSSVLDDLFARGSFERVAADLLFPALERLGEAWAGGEVSVAGEHMASSAVQRRLALALEAAGSAVAPGGEARRVIVGLPAGGRHELGALAFAVAARRAGIPVTYLGTDLPIEDWVSAAADAGAAVIGAVIPRDRGPAMDVARRLRAADPDLVVAFGGRSSPPSSEFLRLPAGLADAVAALAAALARA